MTQVHALLGQLAIALDLIAVGWSVTLVVIRRSPGTLFLGSLVWIVAVVWLAALLGLLTALFIHLPGDVLHIVYGILAAAVLPGAAIMAAARPANQRAPVVAIASVVLLILLARLLQTG